MLDFFRLAIDYIRVLCPLIFLAVSIFYICNYAKDRYSRMWCVVLLVVLYLPCLTSVLRPFCGPFLSERQHYWTAIGLTYDAQWLENQQQSKVYAERALREFDQSGPLKQLPGAMHLREDCLLVLGNLKAITELKTEYSKLYSGQSLEPNFTLSFEPIAIKEVTGGLQSADEKLLLRRLELHRLELPADVSSSQEYIGSGWPTRPIVDDYELLQADSLKQHNYIKSVYYWWWARSVEVGGIPYNLYCLTIRPRGCC